MVDDALLASERKTHVAKATGAIPAACNRCFGHRLRRMQTPSRYAAQSVTTPRGDAGFNWKVGLIRRIRSSKERRRIGQAREGIDRKEGEGRRLYAMPDFLSRRFVARFHWLPRGVDRIAKSEGKLSRRFRLRPPHASGLNSRSLTTNRSMSTAKAASQLGASRLNFRALAQIGDKVVGMFDTDGEANRAFADAGLSVAPRPTSRRGSSSPETPRATRSLPAIRQAGRVSFHKESVRHRHARRGRRS